MTSSCTRLSWITAQADGTEHAVTDEAHVAGMEVGDGVFEAVCGVRFLAACMDAGPLDRCSLCVAFLHARAEMRSFEERMNRPSWLSRLCHRHKQPADVGSEPTISPTTRPRPPVPSHRLERTVVPEDGHASESAPTGARHRRGRHAA